MVPCSAVLGVAAGRVTAWGLAAAQLGPSSLGAGLRASCAPQAMPRTPSQADARFQAFLPLAEAIARGFQQRGGRVLELEDCRQVARMALWLACSRIADPISAPAYLSRCIRGDLLHHARDLGRMIRVPRRVQEAATAPLPWHLASLDQPLPSGQGSLLDQIPDPQPMAEPAEGQGAAVAALLDQLPARQAAVIRLRHLQGISCRDAAQQLGISRMGVCREEQRGLAQLRRALGA